MRKSLVGLCAILWFSCVAAATTSIEAPIPPTGIESVDHEDAFFPGATFDPMVPTPDSVLGFSLGQRFASPAEIQHCLQVWQEASPRLHLVEYARSHEGRPLFYLVITSPGNQARRDAIRSGLARLADPRDLEESEAEQLLAELPAVAWYSYSIHGNETSGADAALAVIYHLAAATGSQVDSLLDELVVIIDPMMNPDGRQRFLQQTTVHGGAMPNLDDQSLQHRGFWPSARTNHYLFDLNRDWILCIHPETRGRVRAIGQWYPILMIDAHEMGALDTYLFSPARDPRNPHYPERRYFWGDVFARDQAAAFDRQGWVYYTGEWADDWYAGYSSWSAFRGSLFILYEQARAAPDGVRRREGGVLTYRESVHHQIASTMANLSTLQTHRDQLLREFLAERQANVSARGPYAHRTFAILPTENGQRMALFRDLLDLQGIEVYRAEMELNVTGAVDQLGRQHDKLTLPAGTLLIPNRQPEARLVAAMLEFDPRLLTETLQRERQEILRRGESRMYDVTAWNLTMLLGLEALQLSQDLPRDSEPAPLDTASTGLQPGTGKAVAIVVDGGDDRSVAVAARLLEQDVQVRVAERSFTWGGNSFARGSVVVAAVDNGLPHGDLLALVDRATAELGVAAWPVATGLGEGEVPDLGGRHFRLLARPRIAVLSHGDISSYDFGAIWYNLDQRLGIRHTHLDVERLDRADLRRYNVLVMPDRGTGQPDSTLLTPLRAWVEAGGTLVAIGGAAQRLADPGTGFVKARQLGDVMDELERYELAVQREWLGRYEPPPSAEVVWSHLLPEPLSIPWREEPESARDVDRSATGTAGEDSRPDRSRELRKRDDWQALFMPQGAFLAGRTDDQHWLTFGTGDILPVLYGSAVGETAVLMAAGGVEAPVRFGYFAPQVPAATETAYPAFRQIGWGAVPAAHDVYLRMSGLLWPEASHRLLNCAYLTREKVGRGQVILFASPPAFRGAALGTTRLLVNALVYGPGLGASQAVEP